ncbi:MAG: helix-turn-helix transcriptional regulator [Clostridia bacterium]|nr:helix-turn-helix transcriptional regulator [Clostridia bacterium]MBR2448798.1 helix-turn-helix transcriptional regulator [Clostridia bacterium]
MKDLNFSNNKIAELRKSNNLSQRKLAQEIGTSQANLSRWEKGLIEPSVIECWKLADYFDVSIDLLCGRKEY